MQKVTLEYFDDLHRGVRICYKKHCLEFENIPYEASDASAVMVLLGFLKRHGIIDISCKDQRSSKWLLEETKDS